MFTNHLKYKIRENLSRLAWQLIMSLNGCHAITALEQNGEQRVIQKLFQYHQTQHRDNSPFVAFDVGANIGDYTRVLYRLAQQANIQLETHAFEPVAQTFQKLIENTRSYSAHNLHLNNLAASNSTGEATIELAEELSAHASLHPKPSASSKNISHTIATIRLEDYIKQHEIAQIHLLKLDVEGHEIRVLQGLGKYLTPTTIPVIQFEYGESNHYAHTSLMDFYTLLEAKGYAIGKIYPSGVNLQRYKPWHENYSYANYLAIARPRIESMRKL